MARIAGVDIPKGKKLIVALTYIYGIGDVRANEILLETNLNPDTRVKDLTEHEVGALKNFIEENYKVEGALRKDVQLNIKRLMDIKSYRGARHKFGLPVRGQRTKTNARTRKGPRGVAVKKKVKAKK